MTGPRVAARPTAADCFSAKLAQSDRNHSARSCSRSRRSSDQDRTAVATTTAPVSVGLVVRQRRLLPRPALSRVQNRLAAGEFPDAVLQVRSPAAGSGTRSLLLQRSGVDHTNTTSTRVFRRVVTGGSRRTICLHATNHRQRVVQGRRLLIQYTSAVKNASRPMTSQTSPECPGTLKARSRRMSLYTDWTVSPLRRRLDCNSVRKRSV